MMLWFGSHTGNTRLIELLYIVTDVWPGIISPDEFQCLVLVQMFCQNMVVVILENSEV